MTVARKPASEGNFRDSGFRLQDQMSRALEPDFQEILLGCRLEVPLEETLHLSRRDSDAAGDLSGRRRFLDSFAHDLNGLDQMPASDAAARL